MNDQNVIDLGSRAIWVAIEVAAPVLVTSLVVGVIISIIQAATQINEQTLSFVPKILVVTAAMIVCGPWILHVMLDFTTDIFNGIPGVTH